MAIIGTEKETNKINTLYKIVNGTLAVEIPNYFRQKERQTRNYHPLKFINAGCRTNIYKYRFFPRSVKEWNRTSRRNYWSCQHRGLQACLEGPGQAPLSIWTSFNFFYFYITSTNSLHCFLAHIARAQHISAEDGLYCPLQIRHLDLDKSCNLLSGTQELKSSLYPFQDTRACFFL